MRQDFVIGPWGDGRNLFAPALRGTQGADTRRASSLSRSYIHAVVRQLCPACLAISSMLAPASRAFAIAPARMSRFQIERSNTSGSRAQTPVLGIVLVVKIRKSSDGIGNGEVVSSILTGSTINSLIVLNFPPAFLSTYGERKKWNHRVTTRSSLALCPWR